MGLRVGRRMELADPQPPNLLCWAAVPTSTRLGLRQCPYVLSLIRQARLSWAALVAASDGSILLAFCVLPSMTSSVPFPEDVCVPGTAWTGLAREERLEPWQWSSYLPGLLCHLGAKSQDLTGFVLCPGRRHILHSGMVSSVRDVIHLFLSICA